MNRHDFLLEIRTEEIPAASLAGARQDLRRASRRGSRKRGSSAEFAQSFATPRRLILVLRGLPERQEDRVSEVLGSARLGRVRRRRQADARGRRLRAGAEGGSRRPRRRRDAARADGGGAADDSGRPAGEVLAADRSAGRRALTFPKTMRWGSGERVFVRPVRGLLALLGGKVVPMEILGIAATGSTGGHRILSGGDFSVRRAGRLSREAARAERRAGRRGAPPRDPGIRSPPGRGRRGLDRIGRRSRRDAGRPRRVAGDRARLLRAGVPRSARGDHDDGDAHAPEVPAGAGPVGPDAPLRRGHGQPRGPKGLIARGNEWVLNARLADARFFFEEDVRETLESRLHAAGAALLSGSARRLPAEDGATGGALRR